MNWKRLKAWMLLPLVVSGLSWPLLSLLFQQKDGELEVKKSPQPSSSPPQTSVLSSSEGATTYLRCMLNDNRNPTQNKGAWPVAMITLPKEKNEKLSLTQRFKDACIVAGGKYEEGWPVFAEPSRAFYDLAQKGDLKTCITADNVTLSAVVFPISSSNLVQRNWNIVLEESCKALKKSLPDASIKQYNRSP
ncbi:MAG: hypothetical protein ACOYK8_06240 [Alphaproteobacteria bacterium]